MAVLVIARGRRASNVLDKIYENLGIIQQLFRKTYDDGGALYPNYNISAMQLYTQIASFILSLISHCCPK